MADLSTPAPRDWPAAFAALPDATPPADGWARVAGALDAEPVHRRPRSRRWPLWLAAAGVAALAALPFLPRVADDARPAAPTLAGSPTAPRPARSPQAAPDPAPRASATADVQRAPAEVAESTAAHGASMPTPRAERVAARGRAATRRAALTAAPERVATASTASAHDGSAALAADDSATKTVPADAVAQAPEADLTGLMAESARLEALVALASDERVGSASGVVLTAGLQDRIGLIDAALSQGGLDDAARATLWQQRISTLRDLAGIESTQRWLAAQGERYDGALVRID